MRRLILGLVASVVIASVHVGVQEASPYKLGTFERQGKAFVGIVLRDAQVIDFGAAHTVVRTPSSTVTPPSDMKDLIARYDAGLRERIAQLVAAGGTGRPAYVYDIKSLKTLPPIMYPTTMLNVAVNYREHAVEMAGRAGAQPASDSSAGRGAPPGTAPPGTKSAPGIWERKQDDTRWNPYMFLKAPAAVIADGEAIRIPPGRSQIDWECELGIVIGRQAAQVAIAQAADHIFGYTIENDVSDREGRGDNRYGSDWTIGKSHDTFAPMGPFIVPKAFVRDPRNLGIKFTLNGKVMQDASSSLMIHDVFEQVSYASHILTLRPGDVIAGGSPAGVGSARTPPIYLKPGDLSVCSYEGIGTLTNPVAAAGK
jgi:2-keto-4-pentenoate hydratase/2-oxohepta-3-ene-1,7-dioic acid hydratase in catechol pathway